MRLLPLLLLVPHIVIGGFKYSVGIGAGHYNPSLESLNNYLQYSPNENTINSSILFQGDIRAHIMNISCGLGVGYFKGNSPGKSSSLSTIPISIDMGYKMTALPALLLFYPGIGYEFAFTKYEDDHLSANGWAKGIFLSLTTNFTVLENTDAELCIRYKFVNANKLKIDETHNPGFKKGDYFIVKNNGPPLPIELDGFYMGVGIRYYP